MDYLGKSPQIASDVFIAPSADIIGDVKIGSQSSIWFQTLIRGDVNWIEIGERTNVQDLSCLHVTGKTAPLKIGDDVTIGHRVMLHGCEIKNRVLIGMGSLIMDHAVIEEDCIVGAGSLITENKRFPSGYLIYGSPAKAVRPLTDEERAFLLISSKNYIDTASHYRKS